MFWMIDYINVTDVLDILILSYLLYRVLLVLQGTRANQSLIGLLILLSLYFLAHWFGLNSIFWLLEKFFVYLVLAVIILFQEDIRKGLAKAGSFFPSIQKEELPAMEEIIKVSFLLAQRRQGALIAIERTASLSEYIDTANRLDARVSLELLQAIFLPNSPLHDGAIIIKDNRIASAQSYLPLSTSKNIHKWYGTRHRAAIGLTETTDSIVIVISEERGTVAIAQNGQLNVLRDSNEMRQAIYDAFKEEKEVEKIDG